MAKERPPDWIPSFNYNTSRVPHPSSSAPGLRGTSSSSSAPQSPLSSDDDDSFSSSITNRCSPKAVHAMVSKLSEFKKQLVRDIGFAGILDIPCITKVNLKLSAWLLSKLDTEDSELVLSECRRIYVHEKDVGIVFGIPCGDIDVASIDITPDQIDSITALCGINGKDARSFRGLEYVLEKHLDDRSTRLELDSFKIAFVIFVMGHLLAPSAKHDCGNLDFWGALKDTELLERMNWCRYVYSHVLEGAQKAREEMLRKNRVTNLTGCHLFLQVLFLDNVDIRGLNKKHTIIPRIRVFDYESLKRMATMCESRGGNDYNSFLGVRAPEGTAYMRHIYQSGSNAPRVPRVPLPPPPLPAGSRQQGSSDILSAETFTFREHADFHAYIQAKYPTLNKLYALDQIKMHNAKMFREITMFRGNVMKLNAMMLDWLVNNIDPVQLQMIHKKPAPGTPVRNNVGMKGTMNSPTAAATPLLHTPYVCAGATSSVVGVDNSPVSPSFSEQGTGCNAMEMSTCYSLKREHNTIDSGALPTKTDSSDRAAPDGKKRRFDIEPPSFDLGIQSSPVDPPCVTPNLNVMAMQGGTSEPTNSRAYERGAAGSKKRRFHIEAPPFDLGIQCSPKSQAVEVHPIISPIPHPSPSPSAYHSSHSNLEMTPIFATEKMAKELVNDLIDIIEDGSSQKDYVLYGQQIFENYIRQEFPLSPLPTPSWPSPEQHQTPDPEVLHMLHIYARDSKHIDPMSIWIQHPLPRHLVISAKEVKENFLTPMLTDFIIVDAIIRRFNQLGVSVLQGQTKLRWRHFLETDFGMQAVAGFLPDQTQSVLNQFIHMEYSVAYCKKIIIPVLVDGIWTAYMFDMEEAVVHILDPAHSDRRYAAHVHFQEVLYALTVKCFKTYFDGYNNPPHADLQVHYPVLCESFASEDSAFCMLHLARHFNGVQLDTPITKDAMEHVRMNFLYEALSLDGNQAEFPSMLARLIQNN